MAECRQVWETTIDKQVVPVVDEKHDRELHALLAAQKEEIGRLRGLLAEWVNGFDPSTFSGDWREALLDGVKRGLRLQEETRRALSEKRG